MDLGSGLIILSAAVLLYLFLYSEVRSFSKAQIFVFSNAAWLLFIPGSFVYYAFRNMRGDYPPFADSIGMPLIETTIAVLIGLIPLNLFLFLTSLKSKFPTSIFINRARYNYKGILWELFWGLFLLLNMVFLTEFTIDGDHCSILISLFFTLILLQLRAGQINADVPDTGAAI